MSQFGSLIASDWSHWLIWALFLVQNGQKHPQVMYNCTGLKYIVVGGPLGGNSGIIFWGPIARFLPFLGQFHPILQTNSTPFCRQGGPNAHLGLHLLLFFHWIWWKVMKALFGCMKGSHWPKNNPNSTMSSPNGPKMGSKWAPNSPKCTKSPQNWPQSLPSCTVYLWSVPL